MSGNNVYLYKLDVTTQGPIYPPSEVMDADGNFVTIGLIPREAEVSWGAAIVRDTSPVPKMGEVRPYHIVKEISEMSAQEQASTILYTLPLPLPLNNYDMLFAPQQRPDAHKDVAKSVPLHEGLIADYREIDGKRHISPITLADWMKAKGLLKVIVNNHTHIARFELEFKDLVPNSLYTIMCLRENDFNPVQPTRPGPLGIPNIIMTDALGTGKYWAELHDPFPPMGLTGRRIINIILLFMSGRQSYGGAIGIHGLGGDVHAQLKLSNNQLDEIRTS